jgi:hypothetical protein
MFEKRTFSPEWFILSYLYHFQAVASFFGGLIFIGSGGDSSL